MSIFELLRIMYVTLKHPLPVMTISLLVPRTDKKNNILSIFPFDNSYAHVVSLNQPGFYH